MPALSSLGWSTERQGQLEALAEPGLIPARVSIEHQDRFTVLGETFETDVKLTGTLLEASRHGDTRPAVGDWVALGPDFEIRHVLPRRTALRRADARGRTQVIAANIDRVFLVTSCNREFNRRRIERYLSAIADSGAEPVVVLNKADSAASPEEFRQSAAEVAPGTRILMTSAHLGTGLEDLRSLVAVGTTVALIGSSGVGKSTLANLLIGSEQLKTSAIREADAKGRHTTTRRELILLPGDSGILIDTPGMRELRVSLEDDALEEAFADIADLAANCQFRDCRHESEPGCAVRGLIDAKRLDSYQKLKREKADLDQRSERRRDKTGKRRR